MLAYTVFKKSVLNQQTQNINTPDALRKLHQLTANPSGTSQFTSGLSWVRVTRSLVLCVCFVDSCLYFFFCPLCCLFFVDMQILIVLWYLQTLLSILIVDK